MPKASLPIKEFHGGLNTVFSSRDVGDNQFIMLEGVAVDSPGKIKLAGSMVELDYTNATYNLFGQNSDYTPDAAGRSLFQFTSDYEALAYNTTEPALLETEYILLHVSNDGKIYYVYKNTNEAAWGGPLTTGLQTTFNNPVFVYAEGVLIVSDGDLTSNVPNQVWSNWVQNFFNGEGSTYNTSGFDVYAGEVTPIKPHNTQVGNNGLVLDIDYAAAVGGEASFINWNDASLSDNFYFYSTRVVRGGQESTPHLTYISSGPDAPILTLEPQIVGTDGNIITGGYWQEQDIGVNIYYRASTEERLWLLLEIDFERGYRKAGEDSWISAWSLEGTHYFYASWDSATVPIRWSYPPQVIDYYSRNGYTPTESIYAQYKTAVVAGRRLYAGNIRQHFDATTSRVYGDRIIKSPVGAYQVLPESSFIDVAVMDGDEIIKLETFADKIIEFKKNAVYVINISGDTEFLEDTFKYIGIDNQCQSTVTPYGVAWINDEGLYFYDGKELANLSKFLLELSDLPSESDVPSIGYHPQKEQLIILTGTAAQTDAIVYDLKTQSFSKAIGSVDANTSKTNFVTTQDGNLIFKQAAKDVQTWDSSPVIQATNNIDFKTKEFDFGDPSRLKKIYKIYLTYRCTGDTNLVVKFFKNGDVSTYYTFSDTTSTYYGSSTLDTTADDGTTLWVNASLKPSTLDEASGIYTFGLYFYNSGNTPADFEIDDMSIVYRLHNAK